MKDISLKDLLEAGCHFGHKAQKWHPKAVSFIYQKREGIHIIDLAKTRNGLKKAADFVKELARERKLILFVATKRQAKGVVTEAAKKAKLPFMTSRWIGGFLTNWSEVKKNIDKVNKLREEKEDDSWNEFPKHEKVKLEKYLRKLENVYSGVADLTSLPEAVFIADIKKEETCLREAVRLSIPTVCIIDTNVDSRDVSYPIPANDDAVGSISYMANYLADAYIEGAKLREKSTAEEEERDKKTQGTKEVKQEKKEEKEIKKEIEKEEKVKEEKEKVKTEEKEKKKIVKEEKPKRKRGRPKKLKTQNAKRKTTT